MKGNGGVLMEAHGVVKGFGATQALKGVDVTLNRGEVHALLGPNGAGKSTFIKIVDGLYRPDAGKIDTHGHKLAFIHQDLGLVPDLTVRENLALAHGGGYRRGGVFIDRKRETAAALRLLEEVQLDVDPDLMIKDIGLGERTLVAIARALDQQAEILVLDEVTAGLTAIESEWLFAEVQRFVAGGGGVIVVSHRLAEIAENCTTTTLFRDGSVAYQGKTPELGLLHELFARADKRDEVSTADVKRSAGPTIATLHEAATPTVGPVSLSVKSGEVLGIVGLLTSGLYEVGHLLAEKTPLVSGTVETTTRTGAGPAKVGFVPEDRWGQGLMPDLDVAENVTMASLPGFATVVGWVRRRHEQARAQEVVEELSVSPARIDLAVGALSGGNAQKVLMGRAATGDPDLYILCEPTRGVDVTTREAIYEFIFRVRDRGAAIVIITIDLDDALAVSDRVAVMRDGRLGEPINRTDVDVERLLALTS